MQKKVDVLAYAMQQLAEYRRTGFSPAEVQEMAERVAKLEDEVLLLNILMERSNRNATIQARKCM